MAVLTDEDYSELSRMSMDFTEDEGQRFLVFRNFQLKTGLYQVDSCEVLVVIPPTYPAAGNDMLWTYPRLQCLDGREIPGTIAMSNHESQRDVRHFDGKTYERWSRHWNSGNQVWRAGRDDISTIVNRITCVLNNPHGV